MKPKAICRRQKALLATGLHVNIEIVSGHPPAEAILFTAAQRSIDTIVMSTHGRSGVLRWVFGSVADKVLRNATVPILLARVAPTASQTESVPLTAIATAADARAQFEPPGSGEIR